MGRASTSMVSEEVGRREIVSKVLGSAALLPALPAFAEIDYAGVGYLGGSSQIDVNNANIRVYQKLPGVYPNAAGKIVTKAPYDSKVLYLEPKPEYVIDQINNGLYR